MSYRQLLQCMKKNAPDMYRGVIDARISRLKARREELRGIYAHEKENEKPDEESLQGVADQGRFVSDELEFYKSL